MNHLSFNQTPSFSLENFEGSLELLLYLIQKEEVDVCAVTIQELTQQLIESLQQSGVETNAELMGLAATLLLMKSQKLLPNEALEIGEPQEDPRVEMIEKLIEYCRFRDAATTLLAREQEQKAHFPRAAPLFCKERGSGLEKVELEGLKEVLFDVMKRAEKKTHLIQDETWHVAPKITWFQETLKIRERIPFDEVFSDTKCRGELIVSFLALLEMMKLQKLMIVRENNFLYITDTNEH
ncbi:MAG: Segregation and condensation protein A [Chlamydiales bacterium]|nr:Segregation and condensation protein A [Chlamydiales bacterium]